MNLVASETIQNCIQISRRGSGKHFWDVAVAARKVGQRIIKFPTRYFPKFWRMLGKFLKSICRKTQVKVKLNLVKFIKE